MTVNEFHTLRRYAMKMLVDEDDRDNLVLLAYQESVRLGEKCEMPLLVHFMKLRARQNNHVFVGAKAGGKSLKDAWNHGTASISRSIKEGHELVDFLPNRAEDPLGSLIVKEYVASLMPVEKDVMAVITEGYTENEAIEMLAMQRKDFRRIKEKVRRKAIKYLV